MSDLIRPITSHFNSQLSTPLYTETILQTIVAIHQGWTGEKIQAKILTLTQATPYTHNKLLRPLTTYCDTHSQTKLPHSYTNLLETPVHLPAHANI